MKKVVSLFLACIILLFGLIVLKFGSALTQEPNTVSIVFATMKLDRSDDPFIKVSETDSIQYVSKWKNEEPYQPVKEYLSHYGWSFKEQIGSGLLFEKEHEDLVIETKKYTKNYYLWKVNKEAIEAN